MTRFGDPRIDTSIVEILPASTIAAAKGEVVFSIQLDSANRTVALDSLAVLLKLFLVILRAIT